MTGEPGTMPQEQPALATVPDAKEAPYTYRSVAEVHVDFLLEEEFYSNDEFRRQFLVACHFDCNLRRVDLFDVARSHLCKHGEIDLRVELSLEDADGVSTSVVLLIENKISAGFQPGQAERYGRARRDEEIVPGRKAITVLAAPDRYIAHGHGFMTAIPYETIGAWLCPNDPVRRKAKTAVLDAAITKSAAHGVQKPDAAMTAFRAAYYDHLLDYNARRNTDFSMHPPALAYAGDNWFNMKTKCLAKWMQFRHMALTGYVEISFRNIDLAKAEPVLRPFVPDDFTLISTGKFNQHATIRRPVTPILAFDDYEKARPIVEASLKHMERLLRVAVDHRARLEAGLVPLLPKAGASNPVGSVKAPPAM